MKVHEYQAKEIFSTYGIPVERHTLCRTAAGVIAAYRRMGTDRVVIKQNSLTPRGGKRVSHKSPSADRRAGKSRRSKVGQ